MEVITRDKENILKTPNTFNIDTPVGYVFNYTEGNLYEWTAESIILGDTLIEGTISCDYYNDGTIKRINNKLITYTKVKGMPIKS